MIGTSYADTTIATGFGQMLARPLFREVDTTALDETAAIELMHRALKVCYYRDKQSINKFTMARITKDGIAISEPFSLETNWEFKVVCHSVSQYHSALCITRHRALSTQQRAQWGRGDCCLHVVVNVTRLHVVICSHAGFSTVRHTCVPFWFCMNKTPSVTRRTGSVGAARRRRPPRQKRRASTCPHTPSSISRCRQFGSV